MQNECEVSVPAHQKLLPLAYPPNPNRVKHDLSKHAFPPKQEISVPSDTPDKLQMIDTTGMPSGVEHNEERKRKNSIDSLESNAAEFSNDEEFEEDPFKQAAKGLIRKAQQ